VKAQHGVGHEHPPHHRDAHLVREAPSGDARG
jgi:hypothetical protein